MGFLVLLVLVLVHPAPLPLDGGTHAWAVRHRDAVAGGARLVTTFGTGPVLVPVLLLAGVPLARRAARWYVVLTGPLLLLAAQLVRVGVMSVVRRPRPPRADWDVFAGGLSFPSGHSTSSAFGYGLVVLLLAPHLRRQAARVVASSGLVLLAGAVGVSRVLLGVHWATDVLGGWTLALALLAVAAWVVDVVSRRRPGTHGQPV